MNYRLIAYAQDFSSFLLEKLGEESNKISQIILFGSVARGGAEKEIGPTKRKKKTIKIITKPHIPNVNFFQLILSSFYKLSSRQSRRLWN